MEKIIFVDIDGPLLPQKMYLFEQNWKTGKENHPVFDPFAVRVFNLWAKYSGAKIVFSTDWAVSYTPDELKDIMTHNGLEFEYHENIVTPKRIHSTRYEEITQWLIDNDECIFIAVDDDTSCALIGNEFECLDISSYGKWIEVDPVNGLTYDNFKEGLEVLGIDSKELMKNEFKTM